MSFVLIVQIVAAIFIGFEAFKLFAGPSRPVWGWLGVLLVVISLMISGVQAHTISGGH